MAKALHPDVQDAALDEIATANIMTVCSAQPNTRTEAVTTYALADVAMAGGDFTKDDGDVSGRKVTVAAKSEITVDASGAGNHVALCDGTRLLAVTTVAQQNLTAGNTVSIGAWKIEYRDPT